MNRNIKIPKNGIQKFRFSVVNRVYFSSVYMEDICKASPRGRVVVKGAMGVLRSQLEVHYTKRQTCELTIEGPDNKWMMLQVTNLNFKFSTDFNSSIYCIFPQFTEI